MKRFNVGTTYMMRSPCNRESTWEYVVVKRSAKTATLQPVDGGDTFRRGITVYEDVETMTPLGRFSMSPTLSADKAVSMDNNQLQQDIINVRTELFRVDTNNCTYQPEGDDRVYFLIGGKPHEVEIKEHLVYAGNHAHMNSHGVKYYIPITGRYYTNPHTIISMISAWQRRSHARTISQ